MPIYEFVCADCGQPFEQLVLNGSKISEVARTNPVQLARTNTVQVARTNTVQVTCPTCKSQNITKKISTFASRFLGGSTFSLGSTPGDSCSTGSV